MEQNPTFRFGWWFGRCSRRHDAGACGEHRESACEHPCRVVAEGLRDPLAERWPEEQRAVDRKREIARCLAPALVGGEILGSAGGADKHRCLAEPGEHSEGDHHAEAGRRRRGDRGEAGDDRAADDEPLTAVSVSQWSDDWADARSGQSKRTDGDADLGVGAAEFALDEQRQDRQGHVEAKEVEGHAGHQRHEARRQQGGANGG